MTNSSFKHDRAWTTLSTVPIVNCGSRLGDNVRKGRTAIDGRLAASPTGPTADATAEARTGSARVSGCCCRKPATSTTLADLLTPPFVANPFSTIRASLRRQSSEEFEDGVAHGRQGWLRRRPVDSFFSALPLRDGDAGGRRKRSLS